MLGWAIKLLMQAEQNEVWKTQKYDDNSLSLTILPTPIFPKNNNKGRNEKQREFALSYGILLCLEPEVFESMNRMLNHDPTISWLKY